MNLRFSPFFSLPVYVVAEFLKSTAMIIKRGSLDKKTGDPEVLYETIRGLLAHPEARMVRYLIIPLRMLYRTS